jgi:nucleoside phosphorylase
MTWSFARARRAAADIRAAPLGPEVIAAIRPRGVVGLVRTRAPLSLLLFVAARDGLVIEQDNGGCAVLQRPAASPPIRTGGYRLRLLRWLDRRWDFVLFGGPPLAGLGLGALAVPFAAGRLAGVVAVAAGLLWVCAFLAGMLAWQLRWLAGLGGPSGRRRQNAESLAAIHWSVPLVHQPDPDLVDDLIRRLTERLSGLIQAGLQTSAGGQARVGRVEVTETLVVRTDGISTRAARALIADSLRALPDDPAADVIVLASSGRLDRASPRPVEGGGFLLLYLGGLALAIAVCAAFVASAEARACRPASCAARPATYLSALRFLLQRLLLSDPSGLSPGTTQAVVLGWLVSVAALVLLAVTFVAIRQEIARNRAANASYDEAISAATGQARVLMLVVTPGERDAVLGAVRERTGRATVCDQAGQLTIYTLGPVAGSELFLAQAAEQGTASAAGMFATARDAIGYCRPDYVILTGICYGLRPDRGQRVGDVVVARRIQNVDHQKMTDDEVQPLTYRGVNVGCSRGLLDRFQAGQPWPGAPVHVGTVLTWNTLVNSEQAVGRLRRDFPDAIAGEMEGAGVYEAAMLDDKPDWIMVKAISDWGCRKTDGDQQLAARNAARFVVHVIAGGALRRRRSVAAR